ncbi:FecR family protein [Methylovulum miyakonense]|uniref:FecR family protein n=1 Tax=Methylovulum miyakonense TaxID=645578 RepID=UPI000365809B|nr:FecR family protein [Methylovulum miyakonense]
MPKRNPEQLEDEALAWLVRSTSGAMSDGQARQLADWLAESPAHREAFASVRQLWEGLGDLQERPLLRAASNPTKNPPPVFHQTLRKPRLIGWAAAASLLLATALLIANPDFWQVWHARYHTEVGELQTVALADGSTVHLNALTTLDPRFSGNQRRIRLFDGEAEFIVSKDKSRPFVVEVDGYEITALGTDFVVKKHGQGLAVTMLESAVKVSAPPSPNFTPRVVKAGQRWSAHPSAVVDINPRTAAAWRHHRLIFESEPLANVLGEINRYRNGHVFLANPALAGLKVSGVFNSDRLDVLLNVINKTLPVKSVALAGRYVMLY